MAPTVIWVSGTLAGAEGEVSCPPDGEGYYSIRRKASGEKPAPARQTTQCRAWDPEQGPSEDLEALQ